MPTSPASPPYYCQSQAVNKHKAPVSQAPPTPPSPASVRMSSSAQNGNDHEFPTPSSLHMPPSTAATSDMKTTESTPTHASHHQDTEMSDAGDARPAVPFLCQIPHPISRPHPSENLIDLYRLQAVASSVRRTDPVTGEKINKLRKSYEGKVKNFGLGGKNKPTDIPGELLGFLDWPDEMWYEQRLQGKELENAESGPVMAKLGRALQMNPGKLPAEEHEKWKSIVALDDGNKTPLLAQNKAAPHQAMLKAQASSMRASAPASPRPSHGIRPDRSNKKRRYDESSYTGYNDGFQDDDGYSTGGMDDKRNSATKKRRKDFPANFESSGNSSGFNNGMLGVGVKSS